MKMKELIELTEAKEITKNCDVNLEVHYAFSSDLMSDVLTLDQHQIVLITGLSNIQLIRTVEMADIPVVLISRNKSATPEMIDIANEIGVILLETPYSMFRSSGILYQNGLKPVF